MAGLAKRLMGKTIEMAAGSGVGVDDDGRLCLPDGLDSKRVHRFIELVVGQPYESPKAAMHDLFRRVGVAPAAIDALNEILGEHGELDWHAITRSPLKLSVTLPRFLEIPERFQHFLVEGLALAEPHHETLEDTVVSARMRAAEQIGCEPCWDAILSRPDGVSEIASGWRASAA